MKYEHQILATASLALMSLTSGAVLAADEPAKSDAPTLGSVLEASGITATGYVAASYSHFDTLVPTYHNFDTARDSFQLDQASLTVAYQPKEGFGALVNIIGGEDALALSTATTSKLAVAQAFVQYAGGPVTVIAGKYPTLLGAEVVAVTGNTNYSRSLLFTYEPAYHTGVRAIIAPIDTLSFMFGVNNGWNYDRNATGSAKTAEVGVSFAPVKIVSLGAYYYSGKDPVLDKVRSIFDFVGTFTVTDSLSFVVSYDNGKQKDAFGAGSDAKWDGVAGYVNYAFNDVLRVSVRYEEFKDKDGYWTLGGLAAPGVEQKLKEGTVTLGIAPAKSYELRLEARQDKSDKSTFVKTNGVATDKQMELAAQALYKF